MELIVTSNYYGSTAYDSSQPQLDNRKSRFVMRAPYVSGGIIEPLSPYHLEPLEGCDLIGGTAFKTDDFYKESRGISTVMKSARYSREYLRAQKLKASRYRLNNKGTWTFWLNLLAMIGYAGGVFGAPLIFILMMIVFLSTPPYSIASFWSDAQIPFWLFCGGYLSYRLFNYIASILPDKKSDYIDRRTGMITFSKNLDKEKNDIPFVDCDPYLFTDNTSGMNKYLLYVDRYDGSYISISVYTTVDVYLLTAYMKEFMDISKPLPDVPELEAYREQDPVTVEYDKKTGRNPRYWRDMSLEELQAKVEEKKKKLRYWFGKDKVPEKRK